MWGAASVCFWHAHITLVHILHHYVLQTYISVLLDSHVKLPFNLCTIHCMF